MGFAFLGILVSNLISYLSTKRHGFIILSIMALGISLISLISGPFDLLSTPSDFTGSLLTYLTYSAGSQGFLITLAVLLLGLLLGSTDKKQFIKVGIGFGVLLVLCFAGKTGLKHFTQSPRPYTEALVQLKLIDTPEQFYSYAESTQDTLVQTAAEYVSHYRIGHWLHETDYSFPSGHTVFVAACLVFFGGLALSQKRYAVTGILLVWALGVAYSRLWLGMHRPEDLFGSMAFVALLYLLVPIPKYR